MKLTNTTLPIDQRLAGLRVAWNSESGCVWVSDANKVRLNGSRLIGCLSDSEHLQARRYRFAADRCAFLVRRALLRVLLSSYVGEPPESLRFGNGPFGKPFLSWPVCEIRFNTSHSGAVMAFAVTTRGEVGVDVEAFRQLDDLEALVPIVLAPSERQQLAEVAPRDRTRAFLESWTIKEAIVKAWGTGLRLPPSQIAIERSPNVRLLGPPTLAAHEWAVAKLSVAGPIVGAVAVLGQRSRG